MWVNLLGTLALLAGAVSADCEPWPEHIASLHDCCVFPHYLDLYTYAECMKHCIEHRENETSCLLDCYTNVTGIVRDKELDVQAVKDVYLENVDTKAWESVIGASIEACRGAVNASDADSLRSSLFAFFYCVKSQSLPHCLEFYGTDECYESEKHFLKCRNVSLDCDTWPERFANETLINCCNFPQLFDDTFTELCEMKCVFDGDVLKCIEQCRYFDTGIVSNGSIDADAIKHRIYMHRHHSKAWDAVIDEAVGTCLGQYYVEHANDTATFSYSQFESCIDFRMSANCVALRTDYECRTLKNFMHDCPDTKPEGFVLDTGRSSRSIDAADLVENLIV